MNGLTLHECWTQQESAKLAIKSQARQRKIKKKNDERKKNLVSIWLGVLFVRNKKKLNQSGVDWDGQID